MRILKFMAVGASGVAVNMGLLWLLTEFAGLFYLFSAIASIEVSIITNFLLNEHWTFSDRRGKNQSMTSRGIKFNVVSMVSLGLNITILFTLTNYFGLHYMLSELIAILAAFVSNFFLNLKWTWN